MAKKYDRTNTWNIFKVKDEDRKSDSHPSYSGYINVNGTEYNLSGWIREAKTTGSKFVGGNVSEKEDKPSNPATNQVKQDEEIPF
jgi:hypothetical protein